MVHSLLSLLFIAILLLIGSIIRKYTGFLRRLFLPASVIGGFVGLIIVQLFGNTFPIEIFTFLKSMPGFLINIVFAGLFLGIAFPTAKNIWKKAGPQLAYGQIVAWGQYTVGIIITILLLMPLFSVPAGFGVIIPVGFEGGHGTASGLAKTFEHFKWAAGYDFGVAAATMGMLFGVLIGMVLINWAVRKKHTVVLNGEAGSIENDQEKSSIPDFFKNITTSSGAAKYLFYGALIALAVIIGILIKEGLILIQNEFFPALKKQKLVQGFPVFPLCMFGGLLIQFILNKSATSKYVEHKKTQHLTGIALDFLVVAAIATIRIDVIASNIIPFLVLVASGIAWNVFCVMFLARRLLPDAWFERSIAEMGQSMGITATGLLLLRVVDPESKTEAFSAFGYKQLFHEPFMGGGLWTSTAIPLVLLQGPKIVLFISLAAICIWFVVWNFAFRKKNSLKTN